MSEEGRSLLAPREYSFKGNAMLAIYTGQKVYKRPDEDESINLGWRKAAAILDNVDALRVFVEKHEKTKGKLPFNSPANGDDDIPF